VLQLQKNIWFTLDHHPTHDDRPWNELAHQDSATVLPLLLHKVPSSLVSFVQRFHSLSLDTEASVDSLSSSNAVGVTLRASIC
jgi:hypothetical protein